MSKNTFSKSDKKNTGSLKLKGSELISVVVPCYNEEESLPLFYEEITRVTDYMKEKYFSEGTADLVFEFIFVNDGSKDGTLKILRELSRRDKRVCYISFSRNFGKEAAMLAGLERANGDYVVNLDADLQHPPKLIPEMYEYVRSGEFDCAATRRINRKGESKVLSFFARSFYKIINAISQTQIVDGAQDFRFMTRQMVNAILSMPEYNRFSKGIFSWVGFETKFIEVENTERAAGKSTFNFRRLFAYSLEGIFAFSTAPLAIASFLGVLFCVISLIMIIVTVVKTLCFGEEVSGYPTTVCLVSLLGGLQLLCTGITGQYISKMYLETKRRPRYIIKETEESADRG
ncbi:MAG: glycosyltransferase family 2 protein [Oscillospiraceae bacterium]|nr:glycosyltransferase family 2 protein [Oscillospiraceae bacterium]